MTNPQCIHIPDGSVVVSGELFDMACAAIAERDKLVAENERLRGNLSLAEEGLANYALEVERLQMRLKRHEPVSLYNGHDIDWWKAEAERLRNIVTGCPVCSELERNIQPSSEPRVGASFLQLWQALSNDVNAVPCQWPDLRDSLHDWLRNRDEQLPQGDSPPRAAMKDPVAGWTIERFSKSDFEVFCTLGDGTVLPLTILSVVRPIGGPDRITIRVEPSYVLKSQGASRNASSIPTDAKDSDPVPPCVHPMAWRRYDGAGQPYCEKCGASNVGISLKSGERYWMCSCEPPGNFNIESVSICKDCGTVRPPTSRT